MSLYIKRFLRRMPSYTRMFVIVLPPVVVFIGGAVLISNVFGLNEEATGLIGFILAAVAIYKLYKIVGC